MNNEKRSTLHYIYADTNTLCLTVLGALTSTHTAVKTGRWTKRERAASGALRPFREASDFIQSSLSVVSSTSPHLAMTYVLIRGASPPAQGLITAEQTEPSIRLTSTGGGKKHKLIEQ